MNTYITSLCKEVPVCLEGICSPFYVCFPLPVSKLLTVYPSPRSLITLALLSIKITVYRCIIEYSKAMVMPVYDSLTFSLGTKLYIRYRKSCSFDQHIVCKNIMKMVHVNISLHSYCNIQHFRLLKDILCGRNHFSV